LFNGLPDSRELCEVKEIVARAHPDHVGHTLFASFRMHAHALQIVGGRGGEQP
jgi:hypothetical protein